MRIELATIQMVVEQHFGYGINVRSRKRHLVDARRLYFRLAREFTNYSLHRLGKSMDLDHATVLFAINSCKDICKVDIEYKGKYLTLRRKLEQINSLKFKKTLYEKPRVLHPGRFRKLGYGKAKPIREIFDQRGQATKQRNELY